MLANVERIDQELMDPRNLESVARSQPEGVAFAVSSAVSSPTRRAPEWVPSKFAAYHLGVSELHLRVLARDGLLEMCESDGTRWVKTSKLEQMKTQANDMQRVFATDAACIQDLRREIVETMAG